MPREVNTYRWAPKHRGKPRGALRRIQNHYIKRRAKVLTLCDRCRLSPGSLPPRFGVSAGLWEVISFGAETTLPALTCQACNYTMINGSQES